MQFVRYSTLIFLALSASVHAGEGAVPLPKLYVCNNDGTDFMVVDMDSNKVVKTIDVGGHPQGSTITAKGDRVYLSCSGPNDVIAVDTATDQIAWRTPCGVNPHQLAVTPDGKFIYVGIFGNAPGNISDMTDVIDTATRKRIKSIKTGPGPHIVYCRSNERVYVTSWMGHYVSVLDVPTRKILKQIPCAGIVRPIVVDEAEKNMYVALSGFHGFVVADLEKGELTNVVENPPYPAGTPVPEHNTPVHGLEIRPGGKELWVTSVIDDKIYIYNLPACALAGKIEVGDGPNWIIFSPDGKRAYVSNAQDNTVSAIDAEARKTTASIKVGKAPKRVIIVADRSKSNN